MRTWPVALVAKYPLPPTRDRDRPWWDGRTRSDGLTIRSASPGMRYYQVPVERIGDNWRYEQVANTEQAQEAWDRVRHIPHPGFRVGQVWAKITEAIDPNYNEITVVTLVAYAEGMWYLGKVGEGITQEVLETSLRGAFLLADTVCPWLAPWAPCVPGEELPK